MANQNLSQQKTGSRKPGNRDQEIVDEGSQTTTTNRPTERPSSGYKPRPSEPETTGNAGNGPTFGNKSAYQGDKSKQGFQETGSQEMAVRERNRPSKGVSDFGTGNRDEERRKGSPRQTKTV